MPFQNRVTPLGELIGTRSAASSTATAAASTTSAASSAGSGR